MAMALKNNQVCIKGVVGFPSLFEKDRNGKYSVTVFIPKDDEETLGRVHKAIDAAMENGRDKLVMKNGKIPSDIRKPVRDGDDKEYDGYAGNYYITSSANRVKRVVDRHNTLICDPQEIYGGCICNVVISFAAYSHPSGGKGIGAYLDGLQKVKDGKRLGGGDFNSFEDLGEDGDDNDFFAED